MKFIDLPKSRHWITSPVTLHTALINATFSLCLLLGSYFVDMGKVTVMKYLSMSVIVFLVVLNNISVTENIH